MRTRSARPTLDLTKTNWDRSEPGKLADVVVLGRNLFETPPAELNAVPIRMTIVGGKIVYEAATTQKRFKSHTMKSDDRVRRSIRRYGFEAASNQSETIIYHNDTMSMTTDSDVLLFVSSW